MGVPYAGKGVFFFTFLRGDRGMAFEMFATVGSSSECKETSDKERAGHLGDMQPTPRVGHASLRSAASARWCLGQESCHFVSHRGRFLEFHLESLCRGLVILLAVALTLSCFSGGLLPAGVLDHSVGN